VKRRFLVLIIVAGGILTAVLYAVLWRSKAITRTAPVVEAETPANQTATKRDSSSSPFVSPNSLTSPQPTMEIGTTSGPLEAALRTPISFWGKVVDQDGQPIDGAPVKIHINDKGMTGSDYSRTTDASGQFSIIGVHGLSLSATVSKEGYDRVKESTKVYGYADGVTRDGPIPTPEAPAVFVLRKRAATSALMIKGVRIPAWQTSSPVGVQLATGRVVNPNEGDIVLRLVNDDPAAKVPPFHPYQWNFRIEVNGGGLIERIDQFNYTAPVDGYRNADEIALPADKTRWVSQFDGDYFVRLQNNQYARVKLSVNSGRNPFITMTAFVNPTAGDRNLESNSSQK
jgi:hypothetical protein